MLLSSNLNKDPNDYPSICISVQRRHLDSSPWLRSLLVEVVALTKYGVLDDWAFQGRFDVCAKFARIVSNVSGNGDVSRSLVQCETPNISRFFPKVVRRVF